MKPIVSLGSNPMVMVSDLIDSTSASWKKEVLEHNFVAIDVKVILGIPLCTKNMEDFLGRNYEKKGSFSKGETARGNYRFV